jgi:hypothetical protein
VTLPLDATGEQRTCRMKDKWSFRLKYPPTPEYAARLAELMVEPARTDPEIDLDFSVGSLKQVDRAIRRMRREGADFGQIATTLFGFGCYVGEVFVRNAGGKWRLTQETDLRDLTKSPMVVEVKQEQLCDPIFKVFSRFAHGIEESLPTFYQVHARVLAEDREESGGIWKRMMGRR